MKNANKKITMNDLAIMVKNGFDDVGTKLAEHDKQFVALKQSQSKQFEVLSQGQEDIKLRLDNVAYRFELVELQKRVETLEKKVGARHK